MKITKTELKSLIKEALKEELGRKPARKIRESRVPVEEFTVEEYADAIGGNIDDWDLDGKKAVKIYEPEDMPNGLVGVQFDDGSFGYVGANRDGFARSKQDMMRIICEKLGRKTFRRGLREDTGRRDVDIKTVPASHCYNNDFFAEEVLDALDWNSSALNRSPIHKFYLSRTPFKAEEIDRDLNVKTYYIPSFIDERAWIEDPNECEFYGFELNNGDFIYTCPGVQPIYVKCKDFESMKNHVINCDNFNNDFIER